MLLHVAALEFVALALVRFLLEAEHGAVVFSSYDLRMGKEGCGVPVLLAAFVRRHLDYYGFASLFHCCALD